MWDPYVLLALVAAVLSGGLARSVQGDETKLTVEQVQELLSMTGNLSGRDLRGMNLTGIDMSAVPSASALRVTEILPPAPHPARPAPFWDTS